MRHLVDHSELKNGPDLSYPEQPIAIIDCLERTLKKKSDSTNNDFMEPAVNARSDLRMRARYSESDYHTSSIKDLSLL